MPRALLRNVESVVGSYLGHNCHLVRSTYQRSSHSAKNVEFNIIR